jgi:hypothetical protein
MLTPKQAKLLASIDPEILAILDLVPVPSLEYKTNQAIQARVNAWIEEAGNTPLKPRQICQIEEASNLPQVKRSIKCAQTNRLPWTIDPERSNEVLRPFKAWGCLSGKNILSPF